MIPPRPTLAALPSRCDVIVVGAGITGAGIALTAAQMGLEVLLIDQRDFASGTSCGSSKLVHGGLRYLQTGQWHLTWESVREREKIVEAMPGLVHSQDFLLPVYNETRPGRSILQLGMWTYDAIAGRFASKWLDADTLLREEPSLRSAGLKGAFRYRDARTDDTRLVLRLIFDAMTAGANVRNYTKALELLRNGDTVCGVAVQDVHTGETREIQSKVVIEATGVWAGGLRGAPGTAPVLRPLRGSHIVFPQQRLPLNNAVSFLHPRDRRPVFAYPWEGAILLGTTDLDHGDADPADPKPSREELDYLMEGLQAQFPQSGLGVGDAIATYAGVRPVVAGGKANPSAESRESALWASPGIVHVTGGKLTTFRIAARQTLRRAANDLNRKPRLATLGAAAGSTPPSRLGAAFDNWISRRPADDHTPVPETPYRWGELRWALRAEQVVHLDDLLLRRTRIGLLRPGGGGELFERIGALCRAELGWDMTRWETELGRYRERWRTLHAPPAA
jgi:glycerol-3-phosphate dehydrogenase